MTAIQLFFTKADPVSIFTLAANAWEVVDTLCDKRGVKSISNESRDHIPEGKDLKKNYVNSPYRNFFKHADRDPDARLDGFDATKCDGVLFLGVEDYLRLMGKGPVEFQIFQLWYLAMYIEKVSDTSLEKILEATDRAFPNIRELSRDEQIRLGAKVLASALSDRSMLEHPGTERFR